MRNKSILRWFLMPLGTIVMILFLYIVVFMIIHGIGIFSDNQVLKLDYPNNEIEIINSNEYVIDSVCIAYSDNVYFSKSLKNKSEGSRMITLNTSNHNYKVYTDSLSALIKDTLLVGRTNVHVFIREKETFF